MSNGEPRRKRFKPLSFLAACCVGASVGYSAATVESWRCLSWQHALIVAAMVFFLVASSIEDSNDR